jgi:hypothetical protein
MAVDGKQQAPMPNGSRRGVANADPTFVPRQNDQITTAR